jgi:hypothetical protein
MQAGLPSTSELSIPWWQVIKGRFKDDLAYEEAMRYGREFRKSQRSEGPPDDSAR